MAAGWWCGLAYSSPAQLPCVGVHAGEREGRFPAPFGSGIGLLLLFVSHGTEQQYRSQLVHNDTPCSSIRVSTSVHMAQRHDRLCLSFHLISGHMSWTLGWILLAEEEVGQTWQTQMYCDGSVGNVWPSPPSGRSSTSTSRRTSPRFRGRLGTLSWSGPCSLPPLLMRQFKAVDARSLVPVMAATSRTRWWTPEVRDAVKPEEGVLSDHVGLWDS
ncbi:hypothetical protein L3Q82_012471 [Scortum barcoo]|uniref:Uncharacterized protein n=1 Tax=Scortum barcoo TaxID=214431 RepID=A0ACB8W3B4_9TELE|nr:hypothetical protein L3Q82_012471 [Scortum barcoo]